MAFQKKKNTHTLTNINIINELLNFKNREADEFLVHYIFFNISHNKFLVHE